MAKIFIDDRPWEMLSEEEKNKESIKHTGQPYRPLTEEEKRDIRKEYSKYLKD